MGVFTIVDVALRIMRRHLGAALVLSLVVIGPGALLTAATGVRFNEEALDLLSLADTGSASSPPVLTASQVEGLVRAAAAFILASAFAGVLGALAALGFSAIVRSDYLAGRTGAQAALRTSLARALPALGVVLLTSLLIVAIIAGGVALMVVAMATLSAGSFEAGGPGVFLALVAGVATVLAVVYLTLRWAVALPLIALEGAGVRSALARSWQLTADGVWRTFAVVGLAGLIAAILAALLSNVLALVLVDVLAPELGLDVVVTEAVVAALASVVLAPLAPVAAAVLYHDLRVRRENCSPG
ncbi:hypothetical protein BH23CHL8_BH23CHL8_31310 [soil metagenome]